LKKIVRKPFLSRVSEDDRSSQVKFFSGCVSKKDAQRFKKYFFYADPVGICLASRAFHIFNFCIIWKKYFFICFAQAVENPHKARKTREL